MTYKLTRKHLAIFRTSVRKYMTQFGIDGGWQIEVALGAVENGLANVGAAARRMDITLASEWNEKPTAALLNRTAKHEVFHILLGRLSALAAKRSASADELYDAEEELVERLMFITAEPGDAEPAAAPEEPATPTT